MINESSNMLFNLLVIIIAMIVHHFWNESKPESPFVKKYGILITYGIAILFCMVFSFYKDNGLNFDLRRIPLWLGTLYGGPFIGFLLAIETIFIRIIQGGPGILGSIISTVSLFLIGHFVRPIYFRLKTFNKVFLAAGINMLFSVIVLFYGSDHLIQSDTINFSINYLIVNLLGIILVSLSEEAIRKNYRKRMELFQAARLETVSHLAAAVNHEVKNPLTTARGMVQLLKYDQTMPQEKRDSLFQLAIDEIDRVDRVVTDYLTFARPYPNQMEKMDIEVSIKEAVSIMEPYANQYNVQISNHHSSCQCYVLGEPAKMVQALGNILKNSIEAIPNGGNITIKTDLKDRECHICILDNGVGMSREVLERLGEPYFTMTGNGTGLGMMVVYRIIESMNGKIKVHSSPGKGTEVILSLPAISD